MKNKIYVPFLDSHIIKEKADNFRKKFWDASIPVDIEYVLDVKLKINVITIPNLKNLCPTHALITSSWDAIYVDNDIYNNERYLNRLRFSYAHEIGHYILHKELYRSFGINNIEGFYKLFEIITPDQYGYLESQANKFANYLLVPRQILNAEKKKIIKTIQKTPELISINKATLNSYISQPLSNIFGVSDKVIEIALNQEE